MYDDIDNERSFWQDEPTRRLGRLPQRALSPRAPHGPRQPEGQRARQHLPIVTTPNRPARRPVDPFLVRLGLILCLGVAMVPIALAVRHGADDVLRTAPTGGASAVPVIGGSLASSITSIVSPVGAGSVVAQTAPMAALEVAESTPTTPTTVFDIDALPPAVPVNDVGTAAATTAAPPTTAAATQKASPPPAATSGAAPSAAVTVATARSEAPKAEAPTTAPTCAKTYEVVSGDYWILIASKADVSVKDLLAANNASTSTPLYPGRNICLPKNASTPATATAPATTAPAKAAPTTAKPATTAAPATTLPSRTYTPAEVEAIIREVWPDELEDEAVRIARRESNLQPTARNSCCYGLFQIYWSVHKGWLGQMGVTSAEQLFDPRVASNAAYTLYQRSGGWGPWAV